MIVRDGFLNHFDRLNEFARKGCRFVDEVNPIDGVVYPNICKDVPQSILNDLYWNLSAILHREPKNPVTFLRMSPADVDVPHKFHTDNSMGDYSLMLYLDDNKDAGTGFAVHSDTGVSSSQVDEDVLAKTIEDCNDDSKWQIYKTVTMVQNRVVVFDSSLFHVALPIGGFGKSQQDARIVLTCFFS